VQRDKRDENVKRNEGVKSCHTFSDGGRGRGAPGRNEINPHGISCDISLRCGAFLVGVCDSLN